MKIRVYIILVALSLLIFASTNLTLGLTEDGSVQQTSQVGSDTDTQWRWGEVVSLDPQNKTLTIKYLDFDTDQEKDLVLVADDSTAYENVKSLQDIQLKDTLSVDFIVSDSKNIAKNISKEKAEDSTTPTGPGEDKITVEEAQADQSTSSQPEPAAAPSLAN